jgi:acyl-CoA dehydrogenase family protein 9
MDEKQIKMAEELLFSGKAKPSFAKGLYFGQFDSEKISPYPRATEAEEGRVKKFCAQLGEYLAESVDADAIDRNAEIPTEVIKGLGKLGLLGMTIPKECGGQGFSQYGYCKAMEQVARHCGSTALFVNAHQSVGLKALLIYGTDAQCQRFLPKLASGDEVAAFSLTEPNAGSDAAGVETRAVYDKEKKIYRINGKKQWTTNGSIASVITLMAQTEVETPSGVEDKITAFLITPDMKGFSVLDESLEKVGMRGSKTANLGFKDVEVSEEHILGKKGRGLNIALDVLNYGRTTFGATCTGSAKECLERAIEHAKSRHQFKRALGTFPLVKEKIARMSALVYAMEATTYLTAGLIDNGQSDVMIESAILKVFASEAQWDVLFDSMQIFGGRSFFTDLPFERMMRDSRLNTIGEGSNDVLRAFIGVVGMRDVGLSLQAGVNALKSPIMNFGSVCKFGGQMIDKMRTPSVPVTSKLLTEDAKVLARAIRRVGLAIPKLLGQYREGIVEKQLLLNRIAEVMIGLYTSSAVLSRLDSDLARVGGDAEKLGTDLAVGRFYCCLASERIDQALAGVKNHSDEQTEAVSDQITALTPVS